MGFSKVYFAECRDAAAFDEDADAAYINNNWRTNRRAIEDTDALFRRLEKKKIEDDAVKLIEDAEDAIRAKVAYWQAEESRVKLELKYFKGDDAEKFFALKAYLKQLAALKRA